MRHGVPPAANPARDTAGSRSGAGASALRERLAAAGRRLGAREAEHRSDLAAAASCCRALHEQVRVALDAFHAAVEEAGAPQLRIELSAPRLDEKHVRAWEFELHRGRHAGLVVVKSRGEVTLVGPFRTGKVEGPCHSVPVDLAAPGAATSDPALGAALGAFLEQLVEEAAAP